MIGSRGCKRGVRGERARDHCQNGFNSLLVGSRIVDMVLPNQYSCHNL